MKKPIKIILWIFLFGGIVNFFVLMKQSDFRAYIMLSISLVCAVLLISDKVKKSKSKKENEEHYDAQIRLVHMDGIPNLTKNCPCIITIKNGIVHISQTSDHAAMATLNLNQITSIGAFTEKEILEKSKSVVGRGIIGGMVLGPVGAIIGGISGTQKKQKNAVRLFLVLNYIPSQSQDVKAITFENVNSFGGTQKFIDYVNAHIVKKTVSL